MSARRQRGSVAVLFALALMTIVGTCGLALELSAVFQRKALLQRTADLAALSAAQVLDGSAAGIASAVARAQGAANVRSLPGAGAMALDAATLNFAADAGGPWLDVAAAQAAPGPLRFARVDMAAQGGGYTQVAALFGDLLGAGRGPTTVPARAVAGPHGLHVLPLAICAASTAATATRVNGGGGANNERVEYGFRYGVAYNLLALNPAAGATAGEYFLVDPVSPPGSAALPANTEDAALAPFMCSGRLAYPSLAGGALNLRRGAGFTLWQQLNSRFDVYGGSHPCDPVAAPPDTNVRSFVGANANWMNSMPPKASAASSTPEPGKPLATIADAAPPLPAVAPAQYGTLWAYGPAKRSTMANFGTGSLAVLYPAAPALSTFGWPLASAPYANISHTTAPSRPGRSERRLLYVPLLSCPVPAGSQVQANVLAVARFLLTAQASASEVPAEFAGIVNERALSADVELLP